ncbi:hypothetical protein KR032_011464 [Drosophila birchii]|nr:hypothetical protein KR032_011464 [Drosophila birchii]
MSRSHILILLLALSGLELLQARSLPDRPHRRYIRRRILPTNPDVEIVEVKDVYLIQRPKKVVTTIDEDEMDWRIRCDFNPSLDECGFFSAPSTTTTTTTSTTTTTTTTEMPVIPETTEPESEPEYDSQPDEVTETEAETELQAESLPIPDPQPDHEYEVPNPDDVIEVEDDTGDNDDVDDDVDDTDDTEDDYDTGINNEEETRSIGLNDPSEWN